MKLPLQVSEGGVILDARGHLICDTDTHAHRRVVVRARANQIVHRVNAHDDLVGACQLALDFICDRRANPVLQSSQEVRNVLRTTLKEATP